MDEQLRLHPFRWNAEPYELLCDVADRQGWRLRLHVLERSRRLELVGHGFELREERNLGVDLNEMASCLLERVEWAIPEGEHRDR